MKKMGFYGLMMGLFLVNFLNVHAQRMAVFNPDDSHCVIRSTEPSIRGDIASVTITVDNNQRYYYEYNWRKKTGYNGVRISWERDVMQIAYDACKKGKSLESLGFKPY